MKDGEKRQNEIWEFIVGNNNRACKGGKLCDMLLEDQKNLYITSEGDLQSLVYFHLRNFLEESNKIARRWFVQNKLFTKRSEKESIYPDIVVSRMRENGKLRPYIAIELKETRNFKFAVVKKDISKLSKLVNRKNSFKYGVLIYACLDETLVSTKNPDYDPAEPESKNDRDDNYPMNDENLWDNMVTRACYTNPKTMKSYTMGWSNASVQVVFINVLAEKWYAKDLENFKRRDKLLRKYSENQK